MGDLEKYLHMQDRTRHAQSECELADTRLILCRIRERAAEFKSQFEPANRISDMDGTIKDTLNAAIDYVLLGRVSK